MLQAVSFPVTTNKHYNRIFFRVSWVFENMRQWDTAVDFCKFVVLIFQIAVVVGGMAPQKQERLLSRRPEIVVATPGRLWELIQDGNPHLAQISNIRCCWDKNITSTYINLFFAWAVFFFSCNKYHWTHLYICDLTKPNLTQLTKCSVSKDVHIHLQLESVKNFDVGFKISTDFCTCFSSFSTLASLKGYVKYHIL